MDVAPIRTEAAQRPRPHRAVLAAVGEAWNDPAATLTDAVAMMNAAARQAAENIEVPDIFDDIDLVCANVGSDDETDPAGAAREYLGLVEARTLVAGIGIPQQRIVSAAILAVENGHAEAVLILGGEAKASALTAKRAGRDPITTPSGPGADTILSRDGEFIAKAELEAGLWDPYSQYAIMDSALARHDGLTPAEHQIQVSNLWARFNAVATNNPEARFASDYSADDLAETTADNRLLAFPYNKHHSTQWAVDHGVALIICTEELARRRGIDFDAILYPQVALDTSWGLSLSRRAEPHRWQTMNVLGAAASEHLGDDVASIPTSEIYSCFPAAVRIQQRELTLPVDGTPTVTGGMSFAGGPLNHFTYMATAAIARQMAGSTSSNALITTVSGLLTKGGLMVWGKEPHPDGALVADVAADARAATATVGVEDFDASLTPEDTDRVLGATVTGGFDPRLITLCRHEGRNAITSTPAGPDLVEDPAGALS